MEDQKHNAFLRDSFLADSAVRASAVIIPPPSDERTENQLWREVLNKGLSKVLQKMRQDLGKMQVPFLVRSISDML